MSAKLVNLKINEIGREVRLFYNKTPFPDYDLQRFNTKEDLRLAAYPFAKILDQSIPEIASVIDVGTGTGQLSAFLSLRRKEVWGIDFSEGQLNKADSLKQKLGLKSWTIQKVDILDHEQVQSIGKQFDYLLCLGVLHHTGNPYDAFKNIIKLLKPNGYIALGLYNTFGRIPLNIRQFLARTVFKNNQAVKDMFIRMQIGDVEDKDRARGWWNDQYCHPHESTHTVGEALSWFKKNKIRFLECVPSLMFFDNSIMEVKGIWNTSEKTPSLFTRTVKQLQWISATNREGGYYILFGRRME
ncbi:class I SAM-dependent methyltransferase [Candidatus Woesearchaeota archaeon]|nr:class I SAM-dependent methyltransferase [Candidatus Woesearchaeota archaeon]